MTTVTTSATALPDRIREGPHWRVAIHPSRYEKERIATLAECWRIVARTRVVRFGWEYPFVAPEQPVGLLVEGSYVGEIDGGERERGDDWIASRHDTNKEYWRLGQSGQFVHLFTFWEDREDAKPVLEYDSYTKWTPHRESPDDLTGYLSFREAIHQFTAIFGFTAGLMFAGALDEAPTVRIEMRNIKDRYLVFYGYPHGSVRPPSHKASGDLGGDKDWRLTLTDDPAKRAREAASWFFERFGYEASETAIKLAQDDFLNNLWRWRC